jgi:chorismate mutase
MSFEELLENYRNQIDTIDFEIIYLLNRRFQIVNQIGKIKKNEGIEPYQADRWKELLDKLVEEADDKNVDKKLVEDIWNLIHTEALKQEK